MTAEKISGIRVDCKTGEIQKIEISVAQPSPSTTEPVVVNLEELVTLLPDIKRLLDYARSMGWI